MRRETSQWTVRMLVDLKPRINVEAEYQRGSVWSRPQQALLIDSILRGFDIPKIYLRKRADGSCHLFDVIDGKQRLTAIWQYFANRLPLLQGDSFPDLGDLSGKRWKDLSSEERDRLQFSTMTVSIIHDTTDTDISELFLRLQRGEPLNAAEKRNAMRGPVRDFVANSMAEHTFWNHTRIRQARFGWHEHSAIVLALVVEDGPTSLKGADLQELYSWKTFNPDGDRARRAIELLDKLDAVARIESGTIRTRWGLVDLALVLMRHAASGGSVQPKMVMRFFESFEERRRDVAEILRELQTRVVTGVVDSDVLTAASSVGEDVGPDELTYHLAFAREGANRDRVAERHTVMYDKFVTFVEKAGSTPTS